jgi:hypothetical protein
LFNSPPFGGLFDFWCNTKQLIRSLEALLAEKNHEFEHGYQNKWDFMRFNAG